MLAFWDVCKHSHEHEKQKTKEGKSLWGRKYGLLVRQIIRKQGEHIVEKSEWSVICLQLKRVRDMTRTYSQLFVSFTFNK